MKIEKDEKCLGENALYDWEGQIYEMGRMEIWMENDWVTADDNELTEWKMKLACFDNELT